MATAARPALLAATLAAFGLACGCVCAAPTAAKAAASHALADAPLASSAPKAAKTATAAPEPHLDRSGRQRIGKASFYGPGFSGRRMADGHRMDPQAAVAASKTLPLGTTAQVTNRETGQTAVVKIQDRGPYVPGRIVDLSPATAQQIGVTPKKGVAEVEVKPLALPPPGEGVAAAKSANP